MGGIFKSPWTSGNIPPPAFNPSDIAGLVGDIDSSAPISGLNQQITKDGSDRISQFTSITPVGEMDFNQPTGANQPLWVANQQNGLAGFRFDRSNTEHLRTDNNVPAGASSQYGGTSFYVVKSNLTNMTGTNGYVSNQQRGGNNQAFGLRQAQSGNQWHSTNRRMTLSTADGTASESIWQSGNTVRITISGSIVSVIVGDYLRLEGFTNPLVNGQFDVTAKNTSPDWIEVTNPFITDNTNDETGASAVFSNHAQGGNNNACNSVDVGNYVLDLNIHLITNVVRANMEFNPLINEWAQEMYIDNDLVGSNTSNLYTYLTLTDAMQIFIGCRQGVTQGFDGDLFQVLIFSRTLNPFEIGEVWNYLNEKWGLGL